MRSKLLFKQIFHIGSFLFLLLAACAPGQETTDSPSIPLTTPEIAPTDMPVPTEMPPTEKPVIVAFAKDGDLQLWNSETNQSYTLLKAGDITTVKMSDDGKVIFFVRRSLGFEPELMEHNFLWAVDSNGENPRELVSDGTLRQALNPPPADSVAFGQISWIPGTHRIIYSATSFYAPGQGSTMSKDIYIVDADTRSNQVLAADIMPTEQLLNAWQFMLSPDGQQIALFTNKELSFINSDGSNWRKAVLTYPAVGAGDGILLPNGVWTQDSRAFIFTGPMESESVFVLNYTIWRVPTDGSPAQSFATLEDSHSASVTFSPDGKYMGYIKGSEWFITALRADLGALAIPYRFDIFYANLNWSPAGIAFLIKDQNLLQLCPDATETSQVCGEPIHLGRNNIINSIQWVDDTRFLFTGLEPSTLSLGDLNGTILPIVTWTDNEPLAGWNSTLLASTPASTAVSAAPSIIPEGKIAYTACDKGDESFNSCEILTINPDGSDPIQLTENNAWDHSPAWGPERSRITFVSVRDGNFEIYAMDADGNGQTNLTNNHAMDSEPAWSPDGSKIVFVSNRDGLGDIYVMDANGGNPIRLTDTEDSSSPDWSPDGTKIVYRRDNPANGGIYVMNADGSNSFRLSGDLFWAGSPAWSPSGTKIAFVTSLSTNIDIYVMNADGSGLTQLTTMSTIDQYPTWSPDGTKVAFSSLNEENGISEIFVMNQDGSGSTKLVFPASLPDW